MKATILSSLGVQIINRSNKMIFFPIFRKNMIMEMETYSYFNRGEHMFFLEITATLDTFTRLAHIPIVFEEFWREIRNYENIPYQGYGIYAIRTYSFNTIYKITKTNKVKSDFASHSNYRTEVLEALFHNGWRLLHKPVLNNGVTLDTLIGTIDGEDI